MTVSSDITGTLGSVSWSEEQLYLKEFVHKHPLPAVVKIVKGQYCNLGVSSLSNPSLHSTILITSLGPSKRILGQSIKFKDNNRRVVPVGPKLAIPNTFDGFFELLSEDGRCVRCIESVAELSRRFPDAILVREPLRAFVSKSDDVDTIEDQSRLVEAGETLLLVGEVMGVKLRNLRTRFLRCFDKNGENVYLPFELKGCKFSAIAKEDNISGVHTVANLTSKRLPLMARLVHGLPPVGLKSSHAFLPEMRLFTVIEEDFLVAMSLSSSGAAGAVTALPLPAMLKVQYATNMPMLASSKEFMRLRERCQELGSTLEDRMVVHDIVLAKDLRINGADLKQRQSPQKVLYPGSASAANAVRRFYGNGDEYDEIEQIYDYVRGFAPLPKAARGWKYEPSSPTKLNSTDDSGGSSDMTPPEPPPLETLPSRMMMMRQSSNDLFSPPPWDRTSTYGSKQNEVIYEPMAGSKQQPEAKKRQRHSAAADKNNENIAPLNSASISTTTTTVPRFLKSANYKNTGSSGNSGTGYRQRFFRTNRSSNTANSQHLQGGPSMFQMRYKSMTNLATQVNNIGEYDTMNSSNSGGKTSGGSSSARQPEKRSRKLSRPKSLTNLVWGTNPSATSKERSASRQSLSQPETNTIMRKFSKDFSSPAHHAAVFANGKKLGSSKKIGTLYL